MTVLASRTARRFAVVLLVLGAAIALRTSPVPWPPQPQIDVDTRLKGFDDYMAQVMRDRNAS